MFFWPSITAIKSPLRTSSPSLACHLISALSGSIIFSVKLNFPGFSLVPANKTAKVDSKQVKQKVARKKTPIKYPSCDRFKTLPILFKFGAGSAGLELGLRLSPKIKNANMRFKAHMAAAIHPGPATPNHPALIAPRAGPRIKPKPKAMPISPIFLERSSGKEMSAI